MAAFVVVGGAASGQELPTAHQDVIIQEATLAVAFEPDLNLLESREGDDPDGPNGPQSCSANNPQTDVLAGTFTFDEGRLQTGCMDFIIGLNVPTGVTVIGLNFTADRVVENASSDLPPGFPPVPELAARSMLQYVELNFSFEGGFETRRYDYYNERSGPHPPAVVDQRFLLPIGATRTEVTWHFQDRGNQNTQPLGRDIGEAFSATVSRINFTWVDFPVPTAPAEASPERSEDGDRRGVVDYVVRTDLPASLLQPEESIEPSAVQRPVTARSRLEIAVAEGPTFEGIHGPNGELTEDDYVITEGDRRTTVSLPPETLAATGPGTYELRYQSVRALPPAPEPEDPTRIYAFYFVLAFLPMVAAALAIHQTYLYVRQAEGPYRRTAWPIAAAVGLVVLYYLVLLGYSLFGIGPRTMSTLPLVREAVLVYIQLVLLLIMLSAAALAVSRTLMGSMRRDLEERLRKEDQLRRSNEELERFAYVASHDLQEPLRKVAGFTALLQKKYAGRLDKDADEIIGFAVDGATRMQMLIKDILAYSRVGSRELQRVQVDANAVMELVTADLGDAIKDSKARVTWRGLPTVRADASQLRQVLQNLVENAIKYSKPGKRPIVQVSGGLDGDAWHFEVKDNGIGIPPDKHEEIFGIFRRLHGQDTRGTGIGLAVAKKAVERHGGKIWVDSRPGRGSTFHFTLPRSAFDSAGMPVSDARGRRRGTTA